MVGIYTICFNSFVLSVNLNTFDYTEDYSELRSLVHHYETFSEWVLIVGVDILKEVGPWIGLPVQFGGSLEFGQYRHLSIGASCILLCIFIKLSSFISRYCSKICKWTVPMTCDCITPFLLGNYQSDILNNSIIKDGLLHNMAATWDSTRFES